MSPSARGIPFLMDCNGTVVNTSEDFMLINKRSRLQRGNVTRWQLLLLVCTILADQEPVLAATTSQPDYCSNPPAAAKANPYRTEAWAGKFLYGGYSTLISSHIMGTRHRILINMLNRYDYTDARESEYQRRLRDFQNDYCSLTEVQTKAILAFARDNRSNSIFQEERSAIFDESQNRTFINSMTNHQGLKPVDNLIRDGEFTSSNFQYNTHRALYNQSYGIPQNSLAAMVNAYVAGIRSIEFDVLETKDNNNVIIHDLTTNRWTGHFNTPPEYVGLHTYQYFKNAQTDIDVLNPLRDTQSVQSTGVKGMLLTDDALHFMNNFMPEMTAYIDARNNSPVSLINLLKYRPGFKDQVVIKIYPFTLSGGFNSVVSEYAVRNRMSRENAAKDIEKIRPNILLAMGSAATQANESVSEGNNSDFTWNKFQSEGVSSYLPFSRQSNSEISRNRFNGQDIFNTSELIQIESMSYNLAKWAFDFSAATNVMVYQVNINPSLKDIVDKNHITEYNAMPKGDKMLSAAIDNFVSLYSRVKAGQQLVITLTLPGGGTKNLRAAIQNTVWGFSDRYPDYTFARNLTNGAINQATIRDFLYSMEGVVYEKNEYSAMKMRSTKAVFDKISEMQRQNLSPRYATTDLPTDLRIGAMGILGTLGLPDDVRYRVSALIKPRFLPENIPGYQRPIWTSRLYGDAAKGREKQFDADVASIIKYLNTEIPRNENAISAIETAKANPNVVITNRLALDHLAEKESVFAKDIPPDQLEHALNILRTDLTAAKTSLEASLTVFKSTYGIEFVWMAEQPYFPQPPESEN
ncbi:Membrane domain of membrane-anchored glycerophosphoryl diester phosphodiesterase [Serratia fonticola]|uniref:glycerophosphodiester phosphodiesterase family protein n=1 Tax=Serratia fonticola TaxID=47917 RepID=UPI002183B429|nr:glycerophosphodiester phosphodiesterase family protein [Serratia fonticola]CAI2017500.1 Membrane domain of membrane-anchored glycerophosphoryl diester phosphodiesterase [Serratia fonticola]